MSQNQPALKPKKIKKIRQEMWWVILAKSKTLRFFAVSCEFILFLGGLWITFTVNDPSSKTWLSGNINMIFLTIMGWAVDAAMPEAWLHVVIQHVQKERGQLGWSKFVAICISVLFIGNIVYSVFTGGDTSGGVSGTPTDATGWILLILVILRISVGFVYITVRQCQEWIKRSNPETQPPALQQDFWPMVAMGAKLQADFEKSLTELASAQSLALVDFSDRQSHKLNLVDLQMQRLLNEIQSQQTEPACVAPEIDYQALAKAILPHLRANIEGHVKAIWEENQSQLQVAPEPAQLEARATSQSHKNGSRATKKPAPEPEKASPNKSPEDRLEAAFLWLVTNSIHVSGRALATRAHVNRGTANEWLSQREKGGSNGSESTIPEPVIEGSYTVAEPQK